MVEFDEKSIKRLVILTLILLLAILVFLVLRPVLLTIIAGLLMAYIFMPVYKKINIFIKNKSLCASIVTLLVILIVIIPIWFTVPIVITQVFEIFKYSQTLSTDIQTIIKYAFPTSSEQFITQMTVTLSSITSNASSAILSALTDFFVNLPTLLMNILIMGFIFFFGLRDSDKLYEFVKGLSPLNKEKEALLVNQFKSITSSIIYGQFIVGVVQGLSAGLGMFLFGVPNALVLTILAVFFSIIPMLGPAFIWVPVSVYLFATGNTNVAVIYFLYNLLIVSTIDNLIRSYIVSRNAKLATPIVFSGMIGGLFVFGVLGLILGPLILAYFITFLEAYKEKSLSRLFFEG